MALRPKFIRVRKGILPTKETRPYHVDNDTLPEIRHGWGVGGAGVAVMVCVGWSVTVAVNVGAGTMK